MLLLFASFVSPSSKQWKREISAVIANDGHECNVLSMFTNSKLFQRLLCLGVGTPELCKLDASLDPTTSDSDHWLSSLNGRNIGRKSTESSDTEAMEYEDIDRYLVTVDSASVAKDMMEGHSSRNSASKLMRGPRRQYGPFYADHGAVPSPGYKDHDPDFTIGQKLSLKIKRKYTKRKKSAKQNGPFLVNEALDGDVTKSQKTRVVKIIDPGMNCFSLSFSLQTSAVQQVLDILMDIMSWKIAKVVSPCLPRGL